jgi:hypothetical protein
VTIYELLTTILPFEASTPTGITAAICQAELAPPSRYRADLPPAIDTWFARALLRRAEGRFPDAARMARAFLSAASGTGDEDEELTPPPASRVPALPRTALGSDEDEDEQTIQWELPEDWSLPQSVPRSPLASSSNPPPLPRQGLTPTPPPASETMGRGFAPASDPRSSRPVPSRPPSSLPPDDGPTETVPPPFSVRGLARSDDAMAPPSSSPAMPSRPALVPEAPFPSGALPSFAPERRPAGYDPTALSASVESLPELEDNPFSAPGQRRRKRVLLALASAAALASLWWFLPVADPRGPGDAATSTQAISPATESGDDEAPPAILRTEDLPTVAEEDDMADPDSPTEPGADPATTPMVAQAGAANVTAPAGAVARKRSIATRRTRKSKSRAKGPCRPPYYFDENGIKRLKMHCL